MSASNRIIAGSKKDALSPRRDLHPIGNLKEIDNNAKLKEQKLGDSNISIDSGMDDSLNQQNSEDQEDADDEIVSHRKKSKKMIIEEDDSEDEVKNAFDEELELSPVKSNAGSRLTDRNADFSDNEDHRLEFDELESDGEETSERKNQGIPDFANPILAEVENQESNLQADISANEQAPLMMHLKDRDLYDAESDEEKRPIEQTEEENQDNDEDQNSDTNQDNEDDEGYDESQIDPELLSRLKKIKGASKTQKQKEKYHRKAKPTAEQMTELYGESQRMLRDSRVNLPYYEPEAKSLDDFLERASQKRKEYSSLRRPKDSPTALIIQEKLSVKLPKTPPRSMGRSKSEQQTSEDNVCCSFTQESQSEDFDTLRPVCSDSGVDTQNIIVSQSSTVQLESSQDETIDKSKECVATDLVTEEIDSELPDLDPLPVKDDSTSTGKCNDLTIKNDSVSASEDSGNNINSSLTEAASENSCFPEGKTTESSLVKAPACENQASESHLPVLPRNPSLDLYGSLSTEELLEKEPSQVNGEEIGGERELAEENILPLSNLSFSNTIRESPEKQLTATCRGNDCDESISETEKSVKKSDRKIALLEKLKQQGTPLPDLPKLSGSSDSVIMLDSEKSSETPKNQGVLKLIDKLIQHSARRKPKPGYDVNLSIVEKESEDGQKQELKLKSVTYHVEEEREEISSATPGSKLMLLKEKLGKGMKQKREEARLRRQQMYNMENEEGYEDNIEDNEEEAEMTDEPDTTDEEEDEDEMEVAYMFNDDDDGKDYNPLLDTEAREEDDEEADDYSNFEEESSDAPLRLELSDEEEEEEEENDSNENDAGYEVKNNGGIDDDDDDDLEVAALGRKKKSKSKVLLSDSEEDEEVCSVLDSTEKQETPITSTNKGKDNNFTFSGMFKEDLTPTSKLSHQFFRENSQSPELYGPSTLDESESSSTRLTDNFNDSFNPHSQMLDADGYLKITQTQKPKSRIGMLVNATQDESAALDIFESTGKVAAGKIFGDASSQQTSQDDNMAELMGLCSGKFQTSVDSDDELDPSQKRKPSKENGSGNDLDFYDPFHILSDKEEEKQGKGGHKRIKPVLSDSEGENGDEPKDISDTENDHDGETVSGLLGKSNKKLRKEFFEDEAELSGSEFDSDENLEIDEADDILELEEGDKDMAGVSDEALRDEVGRVHMKQMQDDDDRQVMRVKEMYLQDGDLHGEGGGRVRNFRWKAIDNLSQQDMFGQESDEDGEEEDKEELKWRKERYEREKFLQESEKDVGNSESSQLVKLGQMFLKRQDSSISSERSQDNSQPSAQIKKSSSSGNGRMKMKGSFLARGKEALVTIARVAKTALGGNSKANSRNFLFQSINSQGNEEDQTEGMPHPVEPTKRKAHSNIPNAPAAKKLKVLKNDSQKPTVKRQNSIFNILEKQ